MNKEKPSDVPEAPPSPSHHIGKTKASDTEEEDPSRKLFKLRRIDAEIIKQTPPADIDALNKIATDRGVSRDQQQKAVAGLTALSRSRGEKQKILCEIRASDPSRVVISTQEASEGAKKLVEAGVTEEKLSWIQQNCPYVLSVASATTEKSLSIDTIASMSPNDLLELAEEKYTKDVAVFVQPGEVYSQSATAEVFVDSEITTSLQKMIESGKLHAKGERQAREGLRNLIALGASEQRLMQLVRTPYLLMAAQNDAAGVLEMTPAELEEWAEFEEANEDAGIDVESSTDEDEDDDGEIQVQEGQEEDLRLNMMSDEALKEAMKPDVEEVVNTVVEEGGELIMYYEELRARVRQHLIEDASDEEEGTGGKSNSRFWTPEEENQLEEILRQEVGIDWKTKLKVRYERHGGLFKVVANAFPKRTLKSLRAKVNRLVANK